jgi:hypothetical protein
VTAAIGPRALQALIAAGAAAVLALWWHAALAISGLGGWLTGAGEILGLLAGYGVVVLVLLMARIRPIGATYTSGGYLKSLQSAIDNGV